MPVSVPRMVKTRLIVAHLAVDLLRTWSMQIRGDDKFGADLDASVIVMAIVIGHLEQRPMSASKISEYIGIPRTTVLRKLQALQVDGMIARTSGAEFVIAANEVNRPERLSFARNAAKLIHRASRELSKMDSD